MPSWFRQLFRCCSGFGRPELKNEADWGSTPSVISSAPSTRRSAESVEVPFDPFGLDDHHRDGRFFVIFKVVNTKGGRTTRWTYHFNFFQQLDCNDNVLNGKNEM